MDYFLGTDMALNSDGDLLVKDGDLVIVDSLDCVKVNLTDRLFADPNDLLLHPGFGAGLMARVSLPLSPDNVSSLVNEIKHELLAEPRVAEVLEITDTQFDRILYITAKVRTIDGQIISNLIFPFELEVL